MADESGKSRKPTGRQGWSQDVARALGRKGGQAKAAKRKLMDSLGLLALAKDSTFAPYRDAADAWLRAASSELAKSFGRVDGAASTMLASAALQLAASRWAFALGVSAGDVEVVRTASQLANHSRASHLAAFNHLTAAREKDACGRTPSSLEAGSGLPPWMETRDA